jgi:hypothetical protein
MHEESCSTAQRDEAAERFQRAREVLSRGVNLVWQASGHCAGRRVVQSRYVDYEVSCGSSVRTRAEPAPRQA